MASSTVRTVDQSPLYLALLPPPPTEVSLSSLMVAYGPGLTRIFQQAAQAAERCLQFDIALFVREDLYLASKPRSHSFAYLQLVLSKFYSLICHISIRNPELNLEAKVDYRVLLVYEKQDGHEQPLIGSQGPICELHGLASAKRAWTDVYALEGELSESNLQKFVNIRKAVPTSQKLNLFNVHRVMGGTSIRLASGPAPTSSSVSNRVHLSIAVGGTFDHIHAGHKLLLTATTLVLQPWTNPASQQERSLTIGITGDELLKSKKYAEVLESWEQRQRAVIAFLAAILDLNADLASLKCQRFSGTEPNANAVHYGFDGNLTVKCVEISDPFGPTITDKEISALVVSGETRSGGKAVNEKRAEKGWEALEVFEISVLDENPKDETDVTIAETFQSKISSTAIRKRIQERSASR